MKYEEIVSIDDKLLNKKYIQSLTYEEREALIEPLFTLFRSTDFLYLVETDAELQKSYQRLLDLEINTSDMESYNNASLGTNICKHFCRSFFLSTERNKPNLVEVFADDKKLRALIKNRLGMDWLRDDERGVGVNEAFSISFKMLVQGMRSMRLVPAISMFKPSIAKLVCMKYSEPGDTVGDYSCGFGGRLLGAISCGRKYQGTDPLTVPELQKMVDYYGFQGTKLINSGSEDYRGEENSVDLYWSSPPYWSQEFYSNDISQAYNQGEDYFYDVYWKKTLENVQYMLKPGKWFGLNVKNYPRMLEMAVDVFGEVVETVQLKTTRSHLTKAAGNVKMEGLYMFRNNK